MHQLLLLLLILRMYYFPPFFYQFKKLAAETLRASQEMREKRIGMRKGVADSSRVKARMPMNTKYSHSSEAVSLPIFSHKGPVTRQCASRNKVHMRRVATATMYVPAMHFLPFSRHIFGKIWKQTSEMNRTTWRV